MAISKWMKGLAVLACLSALPAQASGAVLTQAVNPAPTQAYTPEKNSPDRTAILGALREMVKSMSGLEVVFVVDHLVVHGDWAWIETQPMSADGTQHYEPVTGLLAKRKGQWRYLEGRPEWGVCEETPECADSRLYFEGLAHKYPGLRRDIFPDTPANP